MSQRTRARTTGGTARKPPKSADQPAATLVQSEATLPLAPETLARTLRAVAAELERDPALARRVAEAVADPAPASATSPALASGTAGSSPPEPADSRPHRAAARTFQPRLVTGTSPELGTGIPDPFALYERLGEAGVRAALEDLRLGTLRAIVREHGLDATGRLARQNDAEKLRAAILAAVAARPQ